jgi:NADH dehydrogenase
MAGSIFLTGTSGYIGAKLLERIQCLPYDQIYCLVRNPAGPPASLLENERINWVYGNITEPQTYAGALSKCETAVHLAALTGKASKAQFFQTNAEGTQKFVEQCEQAGVNQLLHVSTIAVSYRDKKDYHYANSKELGEQAVKSSRLRYTIIRPTIVIGESSALWAGLSRLARGPIIPMLGNGATQIQPIDVDDLADCLAAILSDQHFNNEIIELGGPDQISFEAFLQKIHYAYHQKNGSVVRLPVNLLRRVLSSLENPFLALLPVTAGQLSALSNDGTIHSSELYLRQAPTMKGVDEMIKLAVSLERSQEKSRQLERECTTYCHYLTGEDPTPYVIDKYQDAHRFASVVADQNTPAFCRFLLDISAKHPFFTRLADAYTSIFYRRSPFRNKLVLLVAILEVVRLLIPILKLQIRLGS